MGAHSHQDISRRSFCLAALASSVVPWQDVLRTESETEFRLNYILASCMYGYMPLSEIMPEVQKVGVDAIDIWPKVHGNQREQLDELGEEKFGDLLAQHEVSLGCITQYKLGPFGLQEEMKLASRLGCKTIVTGSAGPRGLKGGELKAAVKKFVEQLKPNLAVAAEEGVTIAIENHGNSLIESPDSMNWLAEFRPNDHLAIAFAPYHLPQEEKLLSDLILSLGDSIAMFYAWQHGHGCTDPLPTEEQLLQMPGRGELDFAPLLASLKRVNYSGWTEIFMHPVPRGIPILEDAASVTEEINHSRDYLERRLAKM